MPKGHAMRLNGKEQDRLEILLENARPRRKNKESKRSERGLPAIDKKM
jgi:hypothetical protein